MKNAILIKFLIVLPLVLFVDYLVMALMGCLGCLFGFGEGFTCGPYCTLGKIFLSLSVVFFLSLIFRDIITKRKS